MHKTTDMNQEDQPGSRKILIIGGAGYLGSVLTRKLLNKGFMVRVLDKLIYDNGCALHELLGKENFSFIHLAGQGH